ncbi:MAG: MOSC domain-containing protein [Gammaproteobacteria bacterium]|nr:MOSC domain-containing protein [Gammaproteobacteria bacterium]
MTDRATPLTGVYTGRTDILKEEGHRSAIVKSLVRKRLRLDSGGLEGDEQADLSAHGGADRALHYYPSEHYAFWLAAFPRHAEKFAPGTFGENVSAAGFTEKNVQIGDAFRIDSAILEISVPRNPCWKLNHRFEIPSFSRQVQNERRSGWFFRVLGPDALQLGDACTRIQSTPSGMTLAALWDIYLAQRPDIDSLRAARDLPALVASWKHALGSRIDWLARNANG